MKRLITVLLLLLIFTSLYSQTKTFRLGFSGTYPVFHNPAGYYGKLQAADWDGYRDLNLNLWQGWRMGDKQAEVLDSLAACNLDGYFQPDSIIWMGSGRISVHEAEDNSSIPFRYNNHHNSGSNYTETWSGENVSGRKYIVIPADTGIKRPVLSGVKENAEYSYSGVPGDPIHQYEFWRDTVTGLNKVDNYIYIKPRMRISTTDAFSNPPKLVARIYILNHDGDTVRYFDIFTENFRHDNTNTYDGRYLEDFWNLPMKVLIDSLNIGRTASYIEWLNKDSCKVDFQVHWYGEVDLWIDYMKVMDEQAYNLFHPDLLQRDFYRGVIIRKAKTLLNHQHGNKLAGFYTEETDYARLRCLEFINKMLQDSINNPRARVVSLFNSWSFNASLRYHTADFVLEYIDKVKPPVFLFAWYPFDGDAGDNPVKLPENINPFIYHECPYEVDTAISHSV